MKDGRWLTLKQLARSTGDAESSVSARIRDFRKEEYGSYLVEKRNHKGPGTFEYRLDITQRVEPERKLKWHGQWWPGTKEPGLFDGKTIPKPPFRFDGSDYVPDRDDARLTGQLLRVFEFLKNGKWRTLSQIEFHTGDPQASISAQIRHLRKERFGSYDLQRRLHPHRSRRTYQYRLSPT
tara:strand:+ start:693 stop:1232 length:540 start_codon:yes stop_codon:yes gene_type:complete